MKNSVGNFYVTLHKMETKQVPSFSVILCALLIGGAGVLSGATVLARGNAGESAPLGATTYETNPMNEPNALGKAMLFLGNLMGFHPNREALKFFENHPQHLYRVVDVTRLSFRITQALCSSDDPRGDGDGTIDNAVLHFLWSFFLTGTLGPADARELLWAHELAPQLGPATFMDLHNNQLGIDFAKQLGVAKVKEIYFQSNASRFAEKFLPVRDHILELIRTNQFRVLKQAPTVSTCAP